VDKLFKIEEGAILAGVVTGIKPYGIFVNIEDEHSGLIHISEISNKYVSDTSKYAKVGDVILVRVVGISKDGRLNLSIKNLKYRVKKYKNRIDNPKIPETPNAFNALREQLPIWIERKR